MVDFFGDRYKKTISRNEFYYFVDCFFRGLSKALLIVPRTIPFDDSFDHSFAVQPSLNYSNFSPQLEARGKFNRLITNGKRPFFLTKDILNIVNLIFADSMSFSAKEFTDKMSSKELKFTSFLERQHRFFQSKNDINSLKFLTSHTC